MGVITRNLRRLGMSEATATAMATGAATAAAGALVGQAMMPEIGTSDYSSETVAAYDPVDEDLAEVAIGQEESTTSRKKKSQRGRTTPSISEPTAPAAPTTATSTGLQI